MNRLTIAQKELRSLKSDLLHGNTLVPPHHVAAIANIYLALTHLKYAELQLAGLPIPRKVTDHDRPHSTLNRDADLPVSDSLRGDVK